MKNPLRPEWLISAAVAAAALGCFDAKTEPSAELLGRWTTDAPAYAERYFDIQERLIVFGVDDFTSHSHYLEGVETRPRLADGREKLVFHYRTRDGKSQLLELEYQEADPSTLRFGHHAEMWTLEVPGGES